MIWRIQVTDPARKNLAALDPQARKRVVEALRKLERELTQQGVPSSKNVKKLKGMEAHFRLRVGTYRAIFTQHEIQTSSGSEGVISVLSVHPRGDAYKNL